MGTHRSILLAGAFASLLLIVGSSAFAIWRNAITAQARVAALHNAHVDAGRALAMVRANVYLAGILTRDYLLDSNPEHARQYADQFAAIRNDTDRCFSTLKAFFQDDAERAALEHLRQEVNAYWDPTEIALDWTPSEKNTRRSEVLGQRVRHREEISALATQVERLMTDTFSRERERTTTADQDFRSSLAWTTGITLLLALGISGATFSRMTALERHSKMAESELRRLSGQVRMAQEQERKYLSRELHDQVGQMLTGLRMELSNLARMHGDAESELSSRIAHAKGIVEQTLQVVRNIAMLLRPSMLDDLGLTPALTWLIKETSRSSSIEIEANIDPSLDSLPDTYRTCIYRVVQEALTNISRHSHARAANVSLNLVDDWVQGSINDNGQGFAAGPNRRGLGLIGMEERARELGGDVNVVSAVGRGTRVEIRVPVPREPEAAYDSNSDRRRSRDRANRAEASI